MMISELGFIFDDFRFLKYFQEGHEFTVEKIMSLRKIFDFKQKVYVYIFDSIEEINKVIPINKTDFIAGLAGNSIILLDFELWRSKFNISFAQIIVHEFTHAAVNKYCRNIPDWLNEGFALHFAQQKDVILDDKSLNDVLKKSSLDFQRYQYEIYGTMFHRLLTQYGIKNLISRLNRNLDWENDEIFGNQNLMKILNL